MDGWIDGGRTGRPTPRPSSGQWALGVGRGRSLAYHPSTQGSSLAVETKPSALTYTCPLNTVIWFFIRKWNGFKKTTKKPTQLRRMAFSPSCHLGARPPVPVSPPPFRAHCISSPILVLWGKTQSWRHWKSWSSFIFSPLLLNMSYILYIYI